MGDKYVVWPATVQNGYLSRTIRTGVARSHEARAQKNYTPEITNSEKASKSISPFTSKGAK